MREHCLSTMFLFWMSLLDVFTSLIYAMEYDCSTQMKYGNFADDRQPCKQIGSSSTDASHVKKFCDLQKDGVKVKGIRKIPNIINYPGLILLLNSHKIKSIKKKDISFDQCYPDMFGDKWDKKDCN